ncbi:hypothetical protein CDN97_09365 [Pantoea sp. AMG 501]|jgi:hypothetical protein|nr:hypothetical protein CDN97_09365 [Pantoea sp. AMG 501]
MIIINLAKFNCLDDVQRLLRSKIELFKNKLQLPLKKIIFAEPDGTPRPTDIEVEEWKTLYGWILLKENDLAAAMSIYEKVENMKSQLTFPELFSKVMSVFTPVYGKAPTHWDVITNNFTFSGIPESLIRIAQKIAYYLQQCDIVLGYLDVLVSEDKNVSDTSVEIELDIRSLVFQSTAEKIIS